MPWINGADAPIPVPLTTETDPETGAEIVTAWRPEYHVNLPTFPQTPDTFMAQRPELVAYRVTPAALSRVFAGEVDPPAAPVLTLALRFADEAEAKAVLVEYWSD